MISVREAFQVFGELREEAIVIACQTARQPWYDVSRRPDLDVLFRGSMGKGSSLGLGLALARPDRKVIVFDGDGSLLMNLGSLVTIAGKAPRNFYHFVLENGVYAGTGGQPIPGQSIVSFKKFALAAGFPVAEEFDRIEDVRRRAREILSLEGPVFVTLKTEVVPNSGECNKDGLPPISEALRRVAVELGGAIPE